MRRNSHVLTLSLAPGFLLSGFAGAQERKVGRDNFGPVMCALEDTRVSREALAVAERFAEALDTSLLLAHAFDPGDVPVGPKTRADLASITHVERSHGAAQLAAGAVG